MKTSRKRRMLDALSFPGGRYIPMGHELRDADVEYWQDLIDKERARLHHSLAFLGIVILALVVILVTGVRP